MHKFLLIAPLLLLSGCGNPSTELLETGSMATLFDAEHGDVSIEVSAVDSEGQPVLRTVYVGMGTRVSVVEDAPAAAPVRTHLRLVKIRVEEGKEKGVVGSVNRQELRSAG